MKKIRLFTVAVAAAAMFSAFGAEMTSDNAVEAFTSGAASTTSVLSEERFGGGTTEATETFQKVDGTVTNSFFNAKIEER